MANDSRLIDWSPVIHLEPSVNRHDLLAVRLQTSAISDQPSTISHQPSTINHQPSTISHQPSTISHQFPSRS
jgi:hypothetical protein